MKREFAFDDALRMLEVMWSVLPLKARQEELELFEIIPDFNPVTQPIPLPRLKENPYTKVCALRRQESLSSSTSSLYESPVPAQLDSPLTSNGRRRGNSSSSWKHQENSDSIYRRTKSNGSSSHDFSDPEMANAVDDSPRKPTIVRPKAQSKAAAEFVTPADDVDSNVFHDPVNCDGADETCLLLGEQSKPDDSHADQNDGEADTDVKILEDFEVLASCEEAVESTKEPTKSHPDSRLPSPDVFGCGNPFLVFLCITVLLQQRDIVMGRSMDSNELAMHFDRMVRKHNVERVLSQARTLYYKYLGHFKNRTASLPSSPKRNIGV